MNTSESAHSENPSQIWVLVFLLGTALTMWFWLDLWLGGGLIGGDIYPYFMPQKTFYADSLKAGTIPLWNPLVGHGYPLVAESQTGVFYPVNLILYSLFDVNTAYNINHLLHYIFAFVMTVALGRELGLKFPGAVLGAIVFVYGWFPPRCCLEWAILTGAYLPACLWALFKYQRTGKLYWLSCLTIFLGLQLLPGHYHLAFITHLSLLVVACSFFCFTVLKQKKARQESGSSFHLMKNFSRQLIVPGAAIVLGILLASVQLLPTWEMKQNSQRKTSSSIDFDPAYGHLPPEYLMQVALPWNWYPSADLDEQLGQMTFFASKAGTNKVEAHLYFGILPLLLALGAAGFLLRKTLVKKKKEEVDSEVSFSDTESALINQQALWVLFGLGIFGIVFATGILVPVLKEVPGFGFFRGPGRYGILMTLAVAMLAGVGLNLFMTRFPKKISLFIAGLVMFVSILDFSWVSTYVTYAWMRPETPIVHRENSPVKAILEQFDSPARIFAPGANLVSSLGVASTPVYLGLGPNEYFDPELIYPPDEVTENQKESTELKLTGEQIEWLQKAGVTHILSFVPANETQLPVKLVWSGIDPFLNSAWGRQEPLYLFELMNSRRRASWEIPCKASNSMNPQIKWVSYAPNQLELEVTTPQKNRLVLTELFNKNWHAFLDNTPVEVEKVDGMFRAISIPAGTHILKWSYRSNSFQVGKGLSIASFTIWILGTLYFLVKK